MKRVSYALLTLLTLYNLYVCSTLVRSGEVNFFNDVARDFLLLQELDIKKIVLIGPRSSTANLFYGPLWTYINYPAYVVGQGNPVVIAWFWIVLACIFLLTGFFMVRKLFGTLSAFAFVLLTSIIMAPHINGVMHAEAMFFFTPVFFFSIAMYMKYRKKRYLALHIITSAMLIQLNIGLGIVFLFLSSLIVFWIIIKYKLWKHLLIFILIPVCLLNFILFDLRHDFRMTQALFSTGASSRFFVTMNSWLENRFNNIVSLELFDYNSQPFFTLCAFVLILILTGIQIKTSKKYRSVYILFLYYYFGYMAMSFFNKGIMLYHYVYLLIPLTTMWLVSFLGTTYPTKTLASRLPKTKVWKTTFLKITLKDITLWCLQNANKILIIPLVVYLYLGNLQGAKGYIATFQASSPQNYNSWKALSTVANKVITMQNGKEFGYYVYAPDAYAYQPRYAMIYNFRAARAKAFEYVKKPTTYIVAAPPPANNQYMTQVWWRKVPVGIASEPIKSKKLQSGFIIEKFNLAPEEQKIPHSKTIELGIHFR